MSGDPLGWVERRVKVTFLNGATLRGVIRQVTFASDGMLAALHVMQGQRHFVVPWSNVQQIEAQR